MSGTDLPTQKINDEMVMAFIADQAPRYGYSSAPDGAFMRMYREPTQFERIRAGLAAALVASGYRREVDVLREAADHFAAGWYDAQQSVLIARELRNLADMSDRATALEQAQPLLAADLCGEVGTGFPNGSYADPTYTEPCALPFDHEEDHDWAQREAREAAEGQERSEEKEHG